MKIMSKQNDNFKKAQQAYDSMIPPPEEKHECERCGKKYYMDDLYNISTDAYEFKIENICLDCLNEIIDFAIKRK